MVGLGQGGWGGVKSVFVVSLGLCVDVIIT